MRKMKKAILVLFMLTAVAGFFCVSGVDAGVPQMINYQGTLTDKDGKPVANGNYTIEFKIYDVPSGGAALWSEKWEPASSQIAVVGGTFNAMLGFLNPIPVAFFADHPVAYLGIKVETDSEMLPRQQITSVGYAFTAGNGIPQGGIIMWSGAVDQIPEGWALCDGVERTLPTGIKITPPNLKDRFVVGAGGGYAVAATGGSTTKDISHTHTYSGTTSDTSATRGIEDGNDHKVTNNDHKHTYSGTTSVGGSTSLNILPPYYALAFIMKL
jgi:hypothetical protein